MIVKSNYMCTTFLTDLPSTKEESVLIAKLRFDIPRFLETDVEKNKAQTVKKRLSLNKDSELLRYLSEVGIRPKYYCDRNNNDYTGEISSKSSYCKSKVYIRNSFFKPGLNIIVRTECIMEPDKLLNLKALNDFILGYKESSK